MSVMRLFAGGALVSALIGYCAAFNMVGLNFLLPGRYSYPIICLLMLAVSVGISLAQANRLAFSEFFWALSGVITALLLPLLIFYRASGLIEGYFILGLGPAVAMTGCLLAWVTWKNRLNYKVTGNRIRYPLIVYLALLAVYGIAHAAGVDPEYLRFLRQQLYLLPIVGTLIGYTLTFFPQKS